MDWFMGKGRRKDKDSPTPPLQDEYRQYLEEQFVQDRITTTDFYKLVSLPKCLDYNEWLATHTISFFNHVNIMYDVISEYCTSETCATMSGPGNVQYTFQEEKTKKTKESAPQYVDNVTMSIHKTILDESIFPTKFEEKTKKTKESAPQYVDNVTMSIHKTILDESIFPTKFGCQFPTTFEATVKKTHKYLFHILAHIYHVHYKELLVLGINGHMNTLFTHFMVFNLKFDLMEEKEYEVLNELLKALMKLLPDPNQNDDAQVVPEISRT